MADLLSYRSHNYLWRVDTDTPEFLRTVSIYRFMDYSHRQYQWRVILNEPIPASGPQDSFIINFPIACTLEVSKVDVNRPDDYRNGKSWVRFSECVPTRRWFPHLIIDRPKDEDFIYAWIELDCKASWTYNK